MKPMKHVAAAMQIVVVKVKRIGSVVQAFAVLRPSLYFVLVLSVTIVIVIVVWILSRKNVSLDSRRGV